MEKASLGVTLLTWMLCISSSTVLMLAVGMQYTVLTPGHIHTFMQGFYVSKIAARPATKGVQYKCGTELSQLMAMISCTFLYCSLSSVPSSCRHHT